MPFYRVLARCFALSWYSPPKITLKQLFASGEVNIGEYWPRLRLSKYSPIFTSPWANNCKRNFLECNLAREIYWNVVFSLLTVPRKFSLPLVSLGIFCLGIPSALKLDILVNQVRASVRFSLVRSNTKKYYQRSRFACFCSISCKLDSIRDDAQQS